jgi:hypothetical protein
MTKRISFRQFFAAAGAACFLLPIVFALACHTSFLALANESVAYRFFLSERILAGEGATAWIWQGFLTSAIQTTLLALTTRLHLVSLADLPAQIAAFSYSYSILVALLGASIFAAAARLARISTLQIALMFIALFFSIFFTRDTGFHWAITPDYFALDNVLATLALFLFYAWGDEDTPRPVLLDTVRVLMGGILAGLMISNKITMAVVAAMPLIPVVFRRPFRFHIVVFRLVLAASGAVAGFYFVLLWLYRFSAPVVAQVLARWYSVVSQPVGGEPGFWAIAVKNYLIGNSYIYLVIFYLAAIALATFGRRDPAPRNALASSLALLAAAAGGAALAFVVYRRPAGTTLYEACVALPVLGCMALAPVLRMRSAPVLVGTAAVLAVGGALCTFPIRAETLSLRASGRMGAAWWHLHQELLAFSAGHAIIDIIPNNSYNYSGVEECLLKGTADFLSWNLNPKAKPLLERFAPGMTFRHELDGVSPDAPYPPGVIVFWVDVSYQPPITNRYPRLRRLDQETGLRRADWQVTQDFFAHAIEVPSAR